MNAKSNTVKKTSDDSNTSAPASEPVKGSNGRTVLVPRTVPKEVAGLETKSAKIRALAAVGWSDGDIGRALGIKPQFAWNVRNKILKKTS